MPFCGKLTNAGERTLETLAMRHAANDLAAKDVVAAKKEIARVERAERAASTKEKSAHKEAQKRAELSSGIIGKPSSHPELVKELEVLFDNGERPL
ncbi:hypothetical protein CYMTET_14940 [Cymbomonas tetramitiformis]|uniref:Uncharacterized protein n=1 Tax=Cymbomonas tetramitiformis TaxID=36881 RepID=A0AAE0GFI9_9CHLO|nr:hypothetical protein CYMTET_14940 [Cymbomonas tetramitiformis]